MNGDDEKGSGHPLPASEEAREDLLPEHLVREKGRGDDDPAPSGPANPVNPDGESYEARPATVL